MTPNQRRYAIIGWLWMAGLVAYVAGGLLVWLLVPPFVPYVGAAVLWMCTIGTLIVDDADGLRLAAVLVSHTVLAWITLPLNDGGQLPLAIVRATFLVSLPLPFVAAAVAVLGARRRADRAVGTT